MNNISKQKVSNWTVTANVVYNTDDPQVVYDMLLAETKYFNRPYNAKRLYQRFSHLRRNKELKALDKLVESVETVSIESLEVLQTVKTLSEYAETNTSKLAVLRLLKTELSGLRRYYMIKKLYTLYASLRRKDEKELYNGK